MEAAVANHGYAVVITEDMAAFFQSVDLCLLLDRAEDLGFPMPLARLAVAMYLAPRYLYNREGVADPITPNRGIAAGCSMAITLVKVYVEFEGPHPLTSDGVRSHCA